MLRAVADIARRAGEMMIRYRDAAIHQKSGHFNFVTDADVAVQRFLQEELLSLLPEARFFAEEQENAPLGDEPTFVVDPIDGTLNFMRHRNASVVSIALLEGKRPRLGVVYNPYADELFAAEEGRGARRNGEGIHVSETPLKNALVSFGTAPYDEDLHDFTMNAARRFLSEAGDLRRTGAAALDLCDVACGRADVFFELRLRPWDVAAGALLVTEAGGRFISLGRDQPYFDGPCGVLASNAPCAAPALQIIREAIK